MTEKKNNFTDCACHRIMCSHRAHVCNLVGVWTKSFMSSHTVFGPVIGEPKSAHECDKEKKPNFFTWKVRCTCVDFPKHSGCTLAPDQ